MRITAVLICYNGAAFIGEALRSVLDQTSSLDEIIVVDDGSTDETASVVASFGPNVRYIWQTNQGPGAARNAGIGAASGDWVAFLDHDDWWYANKLARQSAAIATCPDAVLCYTRTTPSSHQNDEVKPNRGVDDANLWPRLRYSNPITLSSVMARRDILLRAGGFRTEIRFGEDWDLWVRMYPLGKFVGVPESLTGYRDHRSGLSSNPELALSCVQTLLEGSLISDLSGPSRFAWRRRILAVQMHKAALSARTNGRNGHGLMLMLRSVLLWPFPGWEPARFTGLAVALRDVVLGYLEQLAT
jgi:glycosyltransferase involved in cell wall biosynthesis